MRASTALLQALTAAPVITGCTGSGPVQAKPPTAPIAYWLLTAVRGHHGGTLDGG